MRSLGQPDRISLGAIGVPGKRRFFILVDAAGGEYWFLIEKQQAAALAEHSMEILRAQGHEPGGADPAALPDREPAQVEFRVGNMAIGLVAGESLVVVTLAPVEGDDSEQVVFEAGFDQLDGMAQAALAAVVSGRPGCPRCNLPMDPEGHTCPSSNGDLRRHRP